MFALIQYLISQVIYKLMSSPYLPNSKARQKKYIQQKKRRNPKLISFQQVSQRSQVGNIFLDSDKSVINQDSRIQINKKKLKAKRIQNNELQLIDDQFIPQGDQSNEQFSILQTIKNFIGVRSSQVIYPQKKIIFINNNNEDENQRSKKRQKLLRQNQKGYSSSFSPLHNSLIVGSLIRYGLVISKSLLFDLQNYFYLMILILGCLQNSFSQGNSQYSTDIRIIIFVICFSMIGKIVFFCFALFRKSFKQNQNKFKVYSHNGISAEWVTKNANDIKQGNIYKIPPNSQIPTDCVLLHAKTCMIQINETNIKSYLSEKNCENIIKETLIKAQSIILPISGKLDIVINKDSKDSLIKGKLDLQEPIQLSHKINTQNIILRGSINCSKDDILCISMQTGINSINLKQLQYPLLQYRDQFNAENNHKNIIQNYLSTFIKLAIIIYVLLSLIAIFIGYLTMTNNNANFYYGSVSFSYQIILYHFTNFIIFIPIMLRLNNLFYSLIMLKLIQNDLSQLTIDYQIANDRDLIGKVNIKDFSILSSIKNTKSFLTSIESFRQQKAYQLHSIKVRDIKFTINKDNLQNSIYQKQQKQLIQYFISVSILSSANIQDQHQKYESSLIRIASHHFNIKISTNTSDRIIISDQFDVCPILIVPQTYQTYYKLCFFYIPEEQVPKDQPKKALCIIRGNPQLILSKTNSKSSNLQSQSKKMYEQKGHYVELIGKFTLLLQDVNLLKKMYQSNLKGKKQFYQWIQQNYFSKIQPMGLLIYNSQYQQSKYKKDICNPILNTMLSNQNFSSQNSFQATMPIIIIVPQPEQQSIHPQFQSIHSITNLLIDPYLFNIPLRDVANKILHDPLPVEEIIQKIQQEKIIVWNGWNKQVIADMIQALKQASFQICAYLQKDDQLYLSKKCSYCITNLKSGYDLQKYADITVQKTYQNKFKWAVFVQFLKFIKIQSPIIQENLFYIFLNQVLMLESFLIVQIINLGYTWSTGISLIRLPLYLLSVFLQLFDIFFFANTSFKVSSFKKKDYSSILLFQTIKVIALIVLGCLVCIYALQKPSTAEGIPMFNQLVILLIHFIIIHLIIFSKLFWISSLSTFKLLVVFLQILIYYIGIIVISSFSLYQFNGAVWYMFKGKQFLVVLFVIWSYLAFQFIKLSFDWYLSKFKKQNLQYSPVKRILNEKNDLNIIQ